MLLSGRFESTRRTASTSYIDALRALFPLCNIVLFKLGIHFYLNTLLNDFVLKSQEQMQALSNWNFLATCDVRMTATTGTHPYIHIYVSKSLTL